MHSSCDWGGLFKPPCLPDHSYSVLLLLCCALAAALWSFATPPAPHHPPGGLCFSLGSCYFIPCNISLTIHLFMLTGSVYKQSPDATLTHSDICAKILDFCSIDTLSSMTELKGSAQISDAGYTTDALSSLSSRTHTHARTQRSSKHKEHWMC